MFYWALILVLLGIILYELYVITDKFSHSNSNIYAIFFASAVVGVVLFSGISINPDQQISSGDKSTLQTTSPTPIKTIPPTPIKTITYQQKPITTSTTIKPAYQPTIFSPGDIVAKTTFDTQDPSIYKSGVVEYKPPIEILRDTDLQVGDIIQMSPNDSRYDPNHAFLIEKILPSSNVPYLIKEILMFGNDKRWVVWSGQSNRLITGGMLLRDYPKKIGHTSVALPQMCWACPSKKPNCAKEDEIIVECG